MLITEFNQAEYGKIVKREITERVRTEMKKEELAKAVRAVREGFIGADVAADLFDIDPEGLEDALNRVTRSRRPFRGCS